MKGRYSFSLVYKIQEVWDEDTKARVYLNESSHGISQK